MTTALRVRRPVATLDIDARVIDGSAAGARASAPAAGLGWLDLVLIFFFMAGLYTNYTIMLSEKLPIPSAPAGFAGLILLVRRRNDMWDPFPYRLAVSIVDAIRHATARCRSWVRAHRLFAAAAICPRHGP